MIHLSSMLEAVSWSSSEAPPHHHQSPHPHHHYLRNHHPRTLPQCTPPQMSLHQRT